VKPIAIVPLADGAAERRALEAANACFFALSARTHDHRGGRPRR
jgi:hypothetical protein